MEHVFSANLGFLWKHLDFLEAVKRAHSTGFDAIECHFPYATDPGELRDKLAELDLPLLSLNTAPGPQEGDFGLAAVPGRTADARAGIKQAFDYAKASDAQYVHVLAGRTPWNADAKRTFVDALLFACDQAERHNICVLIEPLNAVDAPDYGLVSFDHAREVIEQVGSPRLRIMFDCYHAHKQGLDIREAFNACQPIIGHVQIAGVPDRGPPVGVPYPAILSQMAMAGYVGAFGAEFIFDPQSGADQFAWLHAYRNDG